MSLLISLVFLKVERSNASFGFEPISTLKIILRQDVSECNVFSGAALKPTATDGLCCNNLLTFY